MTVQVYGTVGDGKHNQNTMAPRRRLQVQSDTALSRQLEHLSAVGYIPTDAKT